MKNFSEISLFQIALRLFNDCWSLLVPFLCIFEPKPLERKYIELPFGSSDNEIFNICASLRFVVLFGCAWELIGVRAGVIAAFWLAVGLLALAHRLPVAFIPPSLPVA